MAATLSTVLEAAMELTDLERSQLVDALLPSIPHPLSAQPLTREELDERWAAYVRGGKQGKTWDEVKQRARERAGIHD